MNTPASRELPPADYLRGLAARLMSIPVVYGVDQGDSDRLNRLATFVERVQSPADKHRYRVSFEWVDPTGAARTENVDVHAVDANQAMIRAANYLQGTRAAGGMQAHRVRVARM